MCLYVFVCDYLYLGVISWVFVLEGYFGLLVSKGKLVILVEDYCSILSEDHLFIKWLVCHGN